MMQIIYPNISTITSAILPKKIEKEIPQAKKVFLDYLKQSLENILFINPTTPKDVNSEIKTLTNNKPSGLAAFQPKYSKLLPSH